MKKSDLFSYFGGRASRPASAPAAPSSKQSKRPKTSAPPTSRRRTRRVRLESDDDDDDDDDFQQPDTIPADEDDDPDHDDPPPPPPSSSRRRKAQPEPPTPPAEPTPTRRRPRVSGSPGGAGDAPPTETKKRLFRAVEEKQERPKSAPAKPDPAEKPAAKRKFNPYAPREAPPNRGKKERPVGAPMCLEKKQFVITGTLDSLEREECSDLCKEYGAKVVGSVSKRVTHLIAGTEAGDTKLDKARELGIPIISEDDLFEMISSSRPAQQPMDTDDDFKPKTKKEEPAEKPEKKKFNPYAPRASPPNKGKKDRPVGAPNCLDHMQVAITGVLDSLEREECADLCKEYGARVVGAVSRKVTHLIVGTEPGESKVQKAREFQIPTISEDDLFALINRTRPPSAAPPTRSSTVPPEKPVKPNFTDLARNVKPAARHDAKCAIEPSAPVRTGDTSLELWVDKYRPHSSADLCGNPGLVRELRDWLTSWKTNFLSGEKRPVSSGGSRKRKAHSVTEGPRAALLAGPPGTGKTTLARTMCRECGFEPHEFNASDTRNKNAVKLLVGDLSLSDAMEKFCFVDDGSAKTRRSPRVAPNGQVLIMDECDGMSAGDRGGIQELIKMIKKSKVPIICIANDDSHQKVRSLANSCLKLKFRRPMATQCRKRLIDIAAREKLQIDPQTAEKIAESCHGDIRQMINCLQAWKSSGQKITFQGVVQRFQMEGKTFENQSIFEVYRKFFEPNKYSLFDRMDEYFTDADLNPLFVQENYLLYGSVAADLNRMALAAESISEGDLVSKSVRFGQRWDLMPTQALMSAIRPGFIAQGYSQGRPNFPSWLGKNSSTNKSKRLNHELEMRCKLQVSGSVKSMRLDYMAPMHYVMTRPLVEYGTSGIEQTIEHLDSYFLTKEDFDVVSELLLSPSVNLSTQLKTTFTRQYNSSSHRVSTVTAVRSKGRAAAGAMAEQGPAGDDIVEEEKVKNDEEEDAVDSAPEDDALVAKPKPKSKRPKSGGPKSGAGGKRPASKSKRK